MIVNRAQLAELFGISTPKVDRLVKRGAPYVSRPVDGKGEWAFNPAAVLEWQIAQKGTPEEAEARAKRSAQVRNAVAVADLRELERDETMSQLVRPEDAAKMIEAGNEVVRGVLQRFPGKVIARMEAPAPNALELLTNEINEILEELPKLELEQVR